MKGKKTKWKVSNQKDSLVGFDISFKYYKDFNLLKTKTVRGAKRAQALALFWQKYRFC